MEKEKSIENYLKKEISLKTQENIEKFKKNKLLDIFEEIFNNCDNINDIINLNILDITESLKNKLIIPCFLLMKKRNLEFNFPNFIEIANEIMKTFI